MTLTSDVTFDPRLRMPLNVHFQSGKKGISIVIYVRNKPAHSFHHLKNP